MEWFGISTPTRQRSEEGSGEREEKREAPQEFVESRDARLAVQHIISGCDTELLRSSYLAQLSL